MQPALALDQERPRSIARRTSRLESLALGSFLNPELQRAQAGDRAAFGIPVLPIRRQQLTDRSTIASDDDLFAFRHSIE